MIQLAWDRLLETCVKRGWNVILLANRAPFWRSEEALRQGQTEPIDPDGLEAMCREVVPGPDGVTVSAGRRSFTIRYGDDYRFRVDVLGEGVPAAIVVTQVGEHAPAPSDRPGPPLPRWRRGDPAMWWELYRAAVGPDGDDVVACAGAPPLIWRTWGLQAFNVPPMGPDEIRSLGHAMVPADRREPVGDGYQDFLFGLGGVELVRGAVFGDPSPNFILLMRMLRKPPTSNPEPPKDD